MNPYTVSAISKIIHASMHGEPDQDVDNITIDSRRIVNPPTALYFAIKGSNRDGHQFIGECYRQGVNHFVVSVLPDDHEKYSGAVFLKVEDTTLALQALAAAYRKQFHFPVIGITGSNGKTVVKEWLSQLLEPGIKIIRSPKSYNSQVGVSLSLFLLEPDAELAILEAGISMKGEMKRLEAMIKPETGIITNIGEAHQENFRDYEEKINEKLELFKDAKVLLYSPDYESIHLQIRKRYPDKNTITWSYQGNHADLIIRRLEQAGERTVIHYSWRQQAGDMTIPFIDKASLENALHCLAYLLWKGYAPDIIRERMQKLAPVAMRLEMKQGINDSVIINDSYNADLNALSIAIDFLNQQSRYAKKTLILSDILQSGQSPGSLYRKVSTLVQARNIDRFIGIGPALKAHANCFSKKGLFFASTGEFLQQFDTETIRDEAVLLKGARPFQFERISRLLEYQMHRTLLEVNLNALLQNLNYFRSGLRNQTRIMVMVKAFSYGSGLYEVASFLQYHRVDYLGVAFTDEGISLRKAGITLPIMVMQPEETNYEALIQQKLEPEIFSFVSLDKFTKSLQKLNLSGYPVHIKVDTGMHRLGFTEEQIPELISRLRENGRISVKSVFSHLAASDESMHDAFTREQFTLIERIKEMFRQAFPHSILYHILNSAGIERFPHMQMDMVRLGIGLYGVSALKGVQLKNISTLKSRIIQVKKVKAGQTVGYGRKGIAREDKTIAVIPIGYADGFNRRLSNGKGVFIINHRKAPVFGNVCMDVSMADITGIPAKVGDEVIIFGEGYSISEMAKTLDTIPYEILTGISQRVKRVYFQDDQ